MPHQEPETTCPSGEARRRPWVPTGDCSTPRGAHGPPEAAVEQGHRPPGHTWACLRLTREPPWLSQLVATLGQQSPHSIQWPVPIDSWRWRHGEAADPQLVGQESQKLPIEVRSLCKLTHQDRDPLPTLREEEIPRPGRCGGLGAARAASCHCRVSRKARRSGDRQRLPARPGPHTGARGSTRQQLSTSSSRQPTSGTAGPPGCVQSSPQGRRRPRAAG